MMDSPLDSRLLTFGLGNLLFAVPLPRVVEAATMGQVEAIPRSRPILLGAMPYRGGVLPVVSLASALGVKGAAGGKLLLVVRLGEELLGFPVDRTGEIVPFPVEGAGLEPVDGDGAVLGRFELREKRCFILRLEKAFASLLS